MLVMFKTLTFRLSSRSNWLLQSQLPQKCQHISKWRLIQMSPRRRSMPKRLGRERSPLLHFLFSHLWLSEYDYTFIVPCLNCGNRPHMLGLDSNISFIWICIFIKSEWFLWLKLQHKSYYCKLCVCVIQRFMMCRSFLNNENMRCSRLSLVLIVLS